MAEETKDPSTVPPYVSFKTLHTFLRSLSQGIPGRIDKSVMPSMSGGAQAQILQAMKYLKLIDAAGKPSDKLASLVNSEGVEFQKTLASVLTENYPFLRDKNFHLSSATPKMLDDEFGKLASGDTVRKCVTFFIPAANAAGIAMSPHIKQPKKRTTGNGKPKKLRSTSISASTGAAPVDTSSQQQQPPPVTWHQMLLSKFPSFDPTWPDEVKAKWFESFNDLMKKGGP